MCFQLVQICIVRQEFCKVLRTAECIQISEYRVALHLAGIFHAQMVRVCEHGHDLLAHIFCLVGQVNAVAQRFAHLCLAVDAGQTQACLVGRQQDLRIHKRIAVYTVELVHDLLALLQHGHLILAHRNGGGAESSDVRCLADGIAEEAHRDACLKTALLDLGFHRRIALYTGNGYQIHIIEGKLCQLRYHGLNKDRGFLRINAAGQVIQCNLQNVLAHLLRMLGVIRQRLGVCDHNIYFVI